MKRSAAMSEIRPLGAPGPRPSSPLAAAVDDMVQGLAHWPLWFTLGNLDIRLRFRRTGLGPIWSTLSFSLLIAALGLVYARVLGEDVRLYLPYLALGLFSWTFIATILQESCDAFVHAETMLKQLYLPRTTLIYRTLWRNLALLGFNFAAILLVLLLCRAGAHRSLPLAAAGLILLCLNLAWVSLLLALATARFRAVSRIVAALLPILMLVTPVIWRPDAVRGLRELAAWNPLWHAIELVRGPVLGETPPLEVWIAAFALALIGGLAAILVFARARARIPYWL
jgi:lipopolysaccharide transport system permease protein